MLACTNPLTFKRLLSFSLCHMLYVATDNDAALLRLHSSDESRIWICAGKLIPELMQTLAKSLRKAVWASSRLWCSQEH